MADQSNHPLSHFFNGVYDAIMHELARANGAPTQGETRRELVGNLYSDRRPALVAACAAGKTPETAAAMLDTIIEKVKELQHWDDADGDFREQYLPREHALHDALAPLQDTMSLAFAAEPADDGTEQQERDPSKRLTWREANQKAMELARNDPQFVHKTQRQWSKAIGCSIGLINELPFWRRVADETGRARKGKSPAVVSLSDKVLATTIDADAETARLIAESKAEEKADQPGERRKARKA